MKPAIEWEIGSDPESLPAVREKLCAFARQCRWPEACTHDLALAVHEALTNVIRHGYGNVGGQPIRIRISKCVTTEGVEGIEVTIRDFGRQIDPASIRGRDLDEVRPGGLGVHIITQIMDSARYEPAEGGGMRLTMQKCPAKLVDPSSAST
ncbi:MAG: ATP-binding protein [Phycisphaerales bacterium]|nr:ATP-binding protein [Phycisphaerales bacterium]